jgi:hypothetical protein
MNVPTYIILSLVAGFFLPWASNKLCDIVNARLTEMLAIMSEIERLHKRGEEYRHLPVKRIDFLRWEAYVFLIASFSLLAISVVGIISSMEIFHSHWWQRVLNPSLLEESTVTNARTLAKGFILIQLLKLWPFYVIFVSLTSAYGLVRNIRAVLPATKRYLLATLKRKLN